MEPYQAGEQFGRLIMPIIFLIIGLVVGISSWKKHKEEQKENNKS